MQIFREHCFTDISTIRYQKCAGECYKVETNTSLAVGVRIVHKSSGSNLD